MAAKENFEDGATYAVMLGVVFTDMTFWQGMAVLVGLLFVSFLLSILREQLTRSD